MTLTLFIGLTLDGAPTPTGLASTQTSLTFDVSKYAPTASRWKRRRMTTTFDDASCSVRCATGLGWWFDGLTIWMTSLADDDDRRWVDWVRHDVTKVDDDDWLSDDDLSWWWSGTMMMMMDERFDDAIAFSYEFIHRWWRMAWSIYRFDCQRMMIDDDDDLGDCNDLRRSMTTFFDLFSTTMESHFDCVFDDDSNWLLYGMTTSRPETSSVYSWTGHAMIVFQAMMYDDASPCLKQVHWLPVHSRIVFKILAIDVWMLHEWWSVWWSMMIPFLTNATNPMIDQAMMIDS